MANFIKVFFLLFFYVIVFFLLASKFIPCAISVHFICTMKIKSSIENDKLKLSMLFM